ncbi:MAG: hypothetical protein ACTHJ3_09925 [Pararhizobium sp.]
MDRIAGTLITAASLALAVPAAAQAAPLSTMGAVGDALMACWKPPANVKNAFVTLSFSFKRDGTLIGPPRPVSIQVPGDQDARKAFIKAAVDAVTHCAPLTFSPELAAGIGGQVFTLAFHSADGRGKGKIAEP